jgi:flagellar basal body-associated protein FliL
MNPCDSPEMSMVWILLIVLAVLVVICIVIIFQWISEVFRILDESDNCDDEHEDVNRVERED